MGLLDQVLGGMMGQPDDGRLPRQGGMGGMGGAALMPVLMSLLSGRGGVGGGLGGMLGGMTGGMGQAGLGHSGTGGLGGLLDQFTRAGHGDVAQSWVGTGPNRPVTPNQVEDALGRAEIDDMSHRTGLGRDDLLSQLSAMLPQAVDRLTPNGRLPNDDEMRHW